MSKQSVSQPQLNLILYFKFKNWVEGHSKGIDTTT